MNATETGHGLAAFRFSQDLDGKGRETDVRAPQPFLTLAEIEREHILRVYEAHSLNKSKTARVLGIDVKTLYNKLKNYGVYSSDEQPSQS